MPSKSTKQHRFMEAVAHDPAFARKAGVPQSVGKDFAAADEGRSFGKSRKRKAERHPQSHEEFLRLGAD